MKSYKSLLFLFGIFAVMVSVEGGDVWCGEIREEYRTNDCANCPSLRPGASCSLDCEYKGTACVQKPVNCMSGDVTMQSIRDGDDLDNPQPVAVKDLKPGDKVRGLNSAQESAWCTIEAVGMFSESGWLYGNYTSDHFVMQPDGSVSAHGEVGERRQGQLYNMITSCPVAVDEVGTGVTAVDRFCGTGNDQMEWTDYVLLHAAMLKIVQASGSYWFSGSAYNRAGNNAASAFTDSNGFLNSMHDLCFTMLSCAKNENECDSFESAAAFFVEEYLQEDPQKKTKESFPALGAPAGTPGSVSYTVTNKFTTPYAIAGYVAAALVFAAGMAAATWYGLRRQAAKKAPVAMVAEQLKTGQPPSPPPTARPEQIC